MPGLLGSDLKVMAARDTQITARGARRARQLLDGHQNIHGEILLHYCVPLAAQLWLLLVRRHTLNLGSCGGKHGRAIRHHLKGGFHFALAAQTVP